MLLGSALICILFWPIDENKAQRIHNMNTNLFWQVFLYTSMTSRNRRKEINSEQYLIWNSIFKDVVNPLICPWKSFSLFTMSQRKIPLYCGLIQLTTSHVHLVCTCLSALMISAVCCEGFDVYGQDQQTAFNSLTLWLVIPLNWNDYLTLRLWHI